MMENDLDGDAVCHHHSESLRAGIEILDRVQAGVSTVLAQSAHHAGAGAETESAESC